MRLKFKAIVIIKQKAISYEMAFQDVYRKINNGCSFYYQKNGCCYCVLHGVLLHLL
jgi:hypothetical protein